MCSDEVLGEGAPLTPRLMGPAPSKVLIQLTRLRRRGGREEGDPRKCGQFIAFQKAGRSVSDLSHGFLERQKLLAIQADNCQ